MRRRRKRKRNRETCKVKGCIREGSGRLPNGLPVPSVTVTFDVVRNTTQ
jgi:hypothetical protein